MRIAIDLDGTAFEFPILFADIAKGLKMCGHDVGYLTAHYDRTMVEDLNDLKFYGFPKPDFYIARTYDERDTYVGEWKARKIEEHNISVLIDDFGSNNPDIEKTFFECNKRALVLKFIGNSPVYD